MARIINSSAAKGASRAKLGEAAGDQNRSDSADSTLAAQIATAERILGRGVGGRPAVQATARRSENIARKIDIRPTISTTAISRASAPQRDPPPPAIPSAAARQITSLDRWIQSRMEQLAELDQRLDEKVRRLETMEARLDALSVDLDSRSRQAKPTDDDLQVAREAVERMIDDAIKRATDGAGRILERIESRAANLSQIETNAQESLTELRVAAQSILSDLTQQTHQTIDQGVRTCAKRIEEQLEHARSEAAGVTIPVDERIEEARERIDAFTVEVGRQVSGIYDHARKLAAESHQGMLEQLRQARDELNHRHDQLAEHARTIVMQVRDESDKLTDPASKAIDRMRQKMRLLEEEWRTILEKRLNEFTSKASEQLHSIQGNAASTHGRIQDTRDSRPPDLRDAA
ncbi:MAG: hypothetical protein JJU36_08930 [Phycisphaeraceae bacterium]|nr:hypothetical protein [Phycisphaeraceae bacterium]